MEKSYLPLRVKISLLMLVFGFAMSPCFAQIIHLSPADVKAQTRINQKEAVLYQADHKESHLEVQNFDPRKGKSGRQQVAVQEEPTAYVSDIEKNAINEGSRETTKKAKTWKSKKENK